MHILRRLIRLLPIILLNSSTAECENYIYNQMYTSFSQVNPCIMRLNGTQAFGCTSDRHGNVGAVHFVKSKLDLQWIFESPQVDAYIVVLPISLFDFDTLKRLNSSDHVNGVMVYRRNGDDIKSFSPEDKCPNRYSGMYRIDKSVGNCAHSWNRDGNEIMMHYWAMPIFFTDDNHTISRTEKCFSEFNQPLHTQRDRSLCALELTSFMLAAKDSGTCIRRSLPGINITPLRFCDALASLNVFVSAIPPGRLFENGRTSHSLPHIFVTARLDSTSLFYGRAPGALSTVTSIVALLLTSNVLHRLLQRANVDAVQKNVMFMLFNGEAYDYIGSSVTVRDMENNEFPSIEQPIRLDNIELFVELSQLFDRHKPFQPVIYHTYGNSNQSVNPRITEFMNTFANISEDGGYNVKVKSRNEKRLPPSSYQSFRARRDIPGFIFSSFDDVFSNDYYHGIYDDASNVEYKFDDGFDINKPNIQSFLTNFSTTLAHTLFEQITGKAATSWTSANAVNPSYSANELLRCYLETWNCDFFSDLSIGAISTTGDDDTNFDFDYYVGVKSSGSPMTKTVYYALDYLTGDRVANVTSYEECRSSGRALGVGRRWYPKLNECVEVSANVADAYSPAFDGPNSALQNSEYSSWTESSWTSQTVRMFLKPSTGYENLSLLIGILLTAISFVFIYWIHENSRELFNFAVNTSGDSEESY